MSIAETYIYFKLMIHCHKTIRLRNNSWNTGIERIQRAHDCKGYWVPTMTFGRMFFTTTP